MVLQHATSDNINPSSCLNYFTLVVLSEDNGVVVEGVNFQAIAWAHPFVVGIYGVLEHVI